MKRRRLLVASATLAVAGCLGGENESGDQSSPDGTGTRTEDREPTTADPAPTREPTTEPVTESDETPLASETETTGETSKTSTAIADVPVGGENNASSGGTGRVTFEGDGSTVIVRGTIVGQDGCRTAVLESVRQESAGLVVTVATEREAATGQACTMALVSIDYRFVVRRDSPPTSVTVVHRGAAGERTVTTATP